MNTSLKSSRVALIYGQMTPWSHSMQLTQVEVAQLQQDNKSKDGCVAKLQHQLQASEQLVNSIEQELIIIKQNLGMAQLQAGAQAKKREALLSRC